jgi:hypothetical protein
MKSIEAGFKLFEWRYEVIEERNALRSVFNGRETSYQVFVMRLLGEGLYRFVILCPIQAEASCLAALGEFLHRINATLPMGAFELDYDQGSLRWVSSVETNGDALPAHWIGASVQRGLTSFETIWPELLAVSEGRLATQDALVRSQLAAELPALNTRFEPQGIALRLSVLDENTPLAVIAQGDHPESAQSALEEIFGSPLPFALKRA